MDLAHIPRRGFPVPNPLVAPIPVAQRKARLWTAPARVLLVLSWGLFFGLIVLLALMITLNLSQPHPVALAWSTSLISFFVVAPLAFIVAAKARSWNCIATADVIPARLVKQRSRKADAVAGCLTFLFFLPMNALVGVLHAVLRGGTLPYRFEIVENYRLRTIKVRLSNDALQYVTTGQIVWLIRPTRFRYGMVWSEEDGHVGTRCLVTGAAYDWFLNASETARRNQHRQPRRRRMIKAFRAIRKRRGAYSKRTAD